MRRATKVGLAAAGGYSVYVAAVQGETMRQIWMRKQVEDPTVRYAPIWVLGRYTNPFPEYRHQTLFEFGYRRLTELFHLHPPGEVPVDKAKLREALPEMVPDFKALSKRWWSPTRWCYKHHTEIALTWLGQSCAFVQFSGGLNILTDPMFSNSVVSSRVGPQRLVPAPVTVAGIPDPSVVLVSHDHQDHLDLDAAAQLSSNAVWVVPQGVGKRLPADAKVVEMTWWERIPMPNVDESLGYEIACTPAMHWSGRAIVDSNTTLWCSFLVLRHGKPLFFHAGDTGYANGLFRSISKVYGKGCELAMIPCGAYRPRWHLRSQHMDPSEAVQAMQDIGAKNMVGVHWGTFVMSEEPFDEPPRRLKEAGIAAKCREGSVRCQTLGQTTVYSA